MADASNVGVARGAIEIDLTRLQAAKNAVVAAARDMEKAFQQVGVAADASAQRQASAFERVQAAASKAGGALGVLASLTTAFGVRSANDIKRVEVTFRALAGSEQLATKYMAQLRDMAEQTRQPYSELLEAATMYIPAVRASGVELSKVMLLSQQLMLKDPTARIKDAVIAINELISGEYISLVRRFELSREAIKPMAALIDKGQYEEALEMLSQYLDGIGASRDAVIKLGESGVTAFSVLRSEAKLTAAEAFEPAADALNKIAMAFADLLQYVREANPQLTKLLGTLTAVVGVTQVGRLAGMIPGMSGVVPVASGGTLLKVGALAGVGYAGAYAGKEIAQFIGRETGNEQVAKSELSDIPRILAQTLVVIVEQLGDLLGGLVDIFSKAGGWFKEALWDVRRALLNGAQAIADGAEEIAKKLGLDRFLRIDFGDFAPRQPTREDVFEAAYAKYPEKTPALVEGGAVMPDEGFDQIYRQVVEVWERTGQDVGDILDDIFSDDKRSAGDKVREAVDGLALSLGRLTGVVEDAKEGVVEFKLPTVGGQGSPYSEEMLDAYEKFSESMSELDADYQRSKLAAEEDFQRTMTREAEDEQIRRARAEESLAMRIESIRSGLAETIAGYDAEFQESVASLTEKHQKDQLERQREYFRQVERLEREHRKNLLTAAARLDAWAVWEEMQNYKQRRQELDENYRTETEARQEQLRERIEQEKKEHDQRIELARAAAEKRIEQERKEFEYSERLAAEDRARRLARARQDFLRQQQEAEAQYQLTRQRRISQFLRELSDMSGHEALKLGILRKGMADIEAEFTAWLNRMRASVAAQGGISGVASGVVGAIGGAIGTVTGAIGGVFSGITAAGGKFVTYQGKVIRVDRYDPATSGGMSAGEWYAWTRRMGYASGGYTGSGNSREIAGYVHRGEYVIPKDGAPVMFSERLSSLLERVSAMVMPVGSHPAQGLPVFPGKPDAARAGIGQVVINVTESRDARQTAQAVRRELLAVLAELGA